MTSNFAKTIQKPCIVLNNALFFSIIETTKSKKLKMKQIGGKYERKSEQKFFVGYGQRSIPM